MADPAGQPTISTHVLDTEQGAPAQGVRVALYRLDVADGPMRLTQALTDADGRVRDLLGRPLAAGDYRIEFDLRRGEGAAGEGREGGEAGFFTRVAIDLTVTDLGRSYHVPLLLAPYAMTTYRGS